ncbi:MAG: inositol monophosphatase [Anaerolineales bacterium]|nr:inositol monophosphatase [Anaerolineales bacterium]MCW5855722.1 inositol monophosphatase [Anaerolineales bacterium]
MTKHEIPADLEHYLTLAVDCARQAGALLEQGYEKEKRVEHKSSAVDWVTEYDRASEELIVGRLTAAYPGHGIVGEEGSRRESQDGHAWYIDPLDGTSNYAHNFPVFSVSIALYKDDVPLVGVVFDPLRDELFTAVQGWGAFLTRAGTKQRLQVSHVASLTAGLIATGFPYDSHTSQHNNITELGAFLRRAQGIRRAGSAALDMAYVAAGRLDGYWEFKLRAWDMAAARLIVEEAGGVLTQPDGQPIQMQEILAVVANNGRIHGEMLEVLAQAAAQRGAQD